MEKEQLRSFKVTFYIKIWIRIQPTYRKRSNGRIRYKKISLGIQYFHTVRYVHCKYRPVHTSTLYSYCPKFGTFLLMNEGVFKGSGIRFASMRIRIPIRRVKSTGIRIGIQHNLTLENTVANLTIWTTRYQYCVRIIRWKDLHEVLEEELAGFVLLPLDLLTAVEINVILPAVPNKKFKFTFHCVPKLKTMWS